VGHATLNPSAVALCGSSVSLRCWRLHSWVLEENGTSIDSGPPSTPAHFVVPVFVPARLSIPPHRPSPPSVTLRDNKKPLVTIEDYKGPFVERKFRKSLPHLRVDWKRRLRALCPYCACEACGCGFLGIQAGSSPLNRCSYTRSAR
jgi:hypothetical protein